MTSSITIRPPNSIVTISDTLEELPDPESFRRGEVFPSTPSCIVVSCESEQDGPTHIAIGPGPKESGNPAFSGFLDTPNRKVAVWTIELEKVLEESVPTSRTRIRIWTNRPTCPTEVFIAIGE